MIEVIADAEGSTLAADVFISAISASSGLQRLLVLMMYVFGLLFTDAAIDHMRIIGTTDPDMDRLFGTVQLSLISIPVF